MAGAITLSDLLDQTTSANLSIKNAAQGMQAQIDEINRQSQISAAAVLKAGDDAAAVETKLGTGNLQAQSDAREIAAHLGTNREAGNYRMLDLADQMTASYDAANAQLDRVNADKSVGITDGPISYLAAQLRLKGDTAQYNAAVDKHNLASDFMDNIVAKTSAATKQQFEIADVRDAASIAAAADENVQKATAEAAKIKMQTAAYNIDGIKSVQQMTAQQLDNNFKFFNAVATDEQRAYTRQMRDEAAALAREKWELAKQERGDNAQIAADVSFGSQILGLGPVNPNYVRQALKFGGPGKDKMYAFYVAGGTSIAANREMVGGNAGEAARVIESTNAPLTPLDSLAKNMLLESLNESRQAIVAAQGQEGLKNTKTIDQMVQISVDAKAQHMLDNIKPGDATNVYQAPPVQTIAEGNEGVASSAFYQKLLRPITSANPDYAADPDKLLGLGLTAVAEGKLTYGEFVSGYATMFRAATVLNRKTRNYEKLHLPIPPMQNSYKTKLTYGTGLGGSGTYDVADPKEVDRAATMYQLHRFNTINPFRSVFSPFEEVPNTTTGEVK